MADGSREHQKANEMNDLYVNVQQEDRSLLSKRHCTNDTSRKIQPLFPCNAKKTEKRQKNHQFPRKPAQTQKGLKEERDNPKKCKKMKENINAGLGAEYLV